MGKLYYYIENIKLSIANSVTSSDTIQYEVYSTTYDIFLPKICVWLHQAFRPTFQFTGITKNKGTR